MSKLQELIQRLCPDGVEYKKLGEIAEVGTGSSDKKDANANGSYPFFVRSKIVERHNCFEYNEEAVIIPGEGGIGEIFHYIKGPYALHQRVYRIHFTSSSVNTRFAYYYLFAHFKAFIMKKAVSATVTSIRKPMIETFPLAVPPLEVQEEIVKILDRFAVYAAELQAELQARKEQYEYYRNLLLTFNPAGCAGGADDEQQGCVTTWGGHSYPIQWKTMGEIIKSLNTGLNPRQFFRLNTADAECFYVTIREIRNGQITINEKTDRINQKALQLCNNRSNLEKFDILFSGTGTIGQVAVIKHTPKNWNIKEGVYAIKPKLSEINPFFLRYILESSKIKESIFKKVSGGTVQSIPMKDLKSILLPVPPLELQEKIVAVLDRFETLVNDLSEGLPAEIAAVKEQYEYYRNRLLTFKEKSA